MRRRRASSAVAVVLVLAAALALVAGPTSPAAASAAPGPPAPFTTWEAFVGHVTEVVAAAPITPEARAAAATGLHDGTTSAGQFIADLRTSPDQVDRVDPVVRLYWAFFRRVPDRSGLLYWVTARRTGSTTLVRTAASFAGSSEFRSRYGSLTNRAFVQLVYANVLGRPADAHGLAFWTGQLDKGRQNRGAVMVGFSESSEYRRKQASEVTASVLPIFLWGRSPTKAELDGWVTQLDGGRTVADLATEIIGAPTFATFAGRQRVVILGDSVPASIVRNGSSAVDPAAYDLVNGGLLACDGADRPPPARRADGEVLQMDAACKKGWRALYPPNLTFDTDLVIVMIGPHAMLDHQLAGTWAHPCHAAARTWYHDDVAARLAYLATRASRVVVVLPAWPGPNSTWVMPADYVKRADCVRQQLRSAAADTATATIDLGSLVCPTSHTSCKPYRTTDGVHIDSGRSGEVLSWMLSAADSVAPPG